MGLKMVQKLVKSLLCFLLIFVSCSKNNNENINNDSKKISSILYKDETNIESVLNDFEYLVKEKDIKKAREVLLSIKDRIEHKKLEFYYGVLDFEEGKYEDAKKRFKDVDTSLSAQALFYLGHIARKEGKIDEAIKYYQESYKYSKNPELLSSIADSFMEKKDYKEAKKYYEEAISYKPDSYVDMYYLANIYFMEKDYIKSKQILERSIEINPAFKKSYIGMSAVYDKLSDKINSYYYYIRALLLDRNYEKTVDFIEKNKIEYSDMRISKIYIVSLFNLNLIEKLSHVIETAIKTYPNDPDMMVYKAIILNKKANEKEAVKLFLDLLNKYPNNFNIVAAYADFIYENAKNDEDYKKAIEYYEKSLYIEPVNTSYRYKLAEIYRKRNEFDKELFHRGILYFYQGQFRESIESLLNIKEPMDKALFFYYLGMSYSEEGKYNEAIESLKNAISLRKDRRFYMELAYNYVKVGQKEVAIKVLKEYPNQSDSEISKTLEYISKNVFYK